jgi:acyl-CoA synthetase (AMP-forming)/AMP-acid ligase II
MLISSVSSAGDTTEQYEDLEHLESHSTLCDVLVWRATHPSYRGRAACSWLDDGHSLASMAATALARAAKSNATADGGHADAAAGAADATAGDSEKVWSYAMLYDRARRVAALLRRHGVEKDPTKPPREQQPRVLLVYPPGLDFVSAFLGCLLAGAIAVPVYPPNPHNLKRDMPIFRGCVDNCRPTVVLTTAAYYIRAVVTIGAAPSTPGGSGGSSAAGGAKVAPIESGGVESGGGRKHLWPAGLPWLKTDQQFLAEHEDDEDYFYDDDGDDESKHRRPENLPLPPPPVSADASGGAGGTGGGGVSAQIQQAKVFASAALEYACASVRAQCSGGSSRRWGQVSRKSREEKDGAEKERLMGAGGDDGRRRNNRWESSDIAFLQYTSGSTSAPKGVMISHSNLMHHVAINKQAMSWNSRSVGISWCPQYHDLGLVVCTLCNFFCGGHVVLFSPFTFIKDPGLWLRAISSYRAAFSAAPNFAYDLVARKYQPTGDGALDLSCWQVRELAHNCCTPTHVVYVICAPEIAHCLSDHTCLQCAGNGGERVRADTLARFTRRFAPFGFRPTAYFPCLGLAEHTIMCSGGLTDAQGQLEPPTLLTVEVASMAVRMEEEEDEAGSSGGYGFGGRSSSSSQQKRRITVVNEAKLTVTAATDLAAAAGSASSGSDGEGVQVLVGCGMPYPRVTLLIVDPVTRQLVPDGDIAAVAGAGGAAGGAGVVSRRYNGRAVVGSGTAEVSSAVGEIWLDSGSKAVGYWAGEDDSMAEASKATFGARLASSPRSSNPALHEKCYLRTGDLGFVHKVRRWE